MYMYGRGKIRGGGLETAEGDSDRVRGAKESVEGGSVDKEEGGDVALRPLHSGRQSLRLSGLRQEGSPEYGQESRRHRHRHRDHRRRPLHHHVQR